MESDRPQSEFNMAVSYLNRLNALFYVCDESAMNLDAHSWFHALLALFRELSTEMTESELKEKQTTIDMINNLISKNNSQYIRTGKQEVSSELYTELHNFELFIRKVLEKAGLQKRMMDDPTKALR